MRWVRWKRMRWVIGGATVILILGSVVEPQLLWVAFGLPLVFGIIMAVIEICAPVAFLRWRTEQMREASTWEQPIYAAFDQWMGFDPDDSQPSPQAIRNTRIAGAFVLVLCLLIIPIIPVLISSTSRGGG